MPGRGRGAVKVRGPCPDFVFWAQKADSYTLKMLPFSQSHNHTPSNMLIVFVLW